MATIHLDCGHLAHGHAGQPIDLSEPRETARLFRNKGPKRCAACLSTQLRCHSTSRTPVSRHRRVATHGRHVGRQKKKKKHDIPTCPHDWQWGGVAGWVASLRGEPEVPSSSPAKKAADFSVIAEWLKIPYVLF